MSKTVHQRFDAAALTYDRHSADVQEKVAAEVAAMTTACRPECILEAGCGTGALTRRMAENHPEAQLVALDTSRRMVHAARQRCCALRNQPRITVADSRCFRSEHLFDLIVSSSALHWMLPLTSTLQHLHTLLRPGGHLTAGLMVQGTLTELQRTRSEVAPAKPLPKILPAADEIIDRLEQAGFQISQHRTENIVTRHGSARALLHALHQQGVTAGTAPALLNRREITRLVRYYDRHYQHPQGGVAATYTVLYFRARRADTE